MPKTKLAKLKAKLLKQWKAIIHSKEACELCDRDWGQLHAHHIEGRKGALLYDLENGILLCVQCHRRGVHHEASSIQAEFRLKIMARRGKEKMEELKQKRCLTTKHGIAHLEELIEYYKTLL